MIIDLDQPMTWEQEQILRKKFESETGARVFYSVDARNVMCDVRDAEKWRELPTWVKKLFSSRLFSQPVLPSSR